ncbi:hypothetical protein [Streptomyces sp. NPDC059761]|uniref:hypothetical protein n=1 Tax=Streptomyces sp. NPDC059761 TaxID=3346937 RepID=UPI003661A0D2
MSPADHDTDSTLRLRLGDQPLPHKGGEPVQERLIEMIKQRRALGIQRYGRPLETFNGRNPLQDAWEEALDLATYLTQLQMEQEARQAGVAKALSLHVADADGRCDTCRVQSPCMTRQALVAPHRPRVNPQVLDALSCATDSAR